MANPSILYEMTQLAHVCSWPFLKSVKAHEHDSKNVLYCSEALKNEWYLCEWYCEFDVLITVDE